MTARPGPVRTAFRHPDLQFAQRTREDFEAELKDSSRSRSRRAQVMLDALDAGREDRKHRVPRQAIRFGRGLTLVALGGEVVIDYDLRLKREFPGEPLIVAGYSNDVMCYIPSARVLREGGYEAVDSMIYYGQPGPFAEDVEERIFAGVRRVMKDMGR